MEATRPHPQLQLRVGTCIYRLATFSYRLSVIIGESRVTLLVIRVDHHMKFRWIAGCRKDDDTGSTHTWHRLPSN